MLHVYTVRQRHTLAVVILSLQSRVSPRRCDRLGEDTKPRKTTHRKEDTKRTRQDEAIHCGRGRAVCCCECRHRRSPSSSSSSACVPQSSRRCWMAIRGLVGGAEQDAQRPTHRHGSAGNAMPRPEIQPGRLCEFAGQLGAAADTVRTCPCLVPCANDGVLTACDVFIAT